MKTNSKMLRYARELRRNMTKQERRLWYDFLRDHSMKFYKQKPVGPYIVDFYCHQAGLVLELDGGQHFEEKGRLADQSRDQFLTGLGLRVIRIPNSEVDKNFPGVCQAIDAALTQASPSGGGGTAKP